MKGVVVFTMQFEKWWKSIVPFCQLPCDDFPIMESGAHHIFDKHDQHADVTQNSHCTVFSLLQNKQYYSPRCWPIRELHQLQHSGRHVGDCSCLCCWHHKAYLGLGRFPRLLCSDALSSGFLCSCSSFSSSGVASFFFFRAYHQVKMWKNVDEPLVEFLTWLDDEAVG